MSAYDLLNQQDEDALHKSRLLSVEERPFKRITKRLLTPGTLVSTPSKLPTPPPDTTDEVAYLEAERQKDIEVRRQLREDVLLDFAAFDSSIARIQFLLKSNASERERYKADREHITETAQQVRDNMAQLRVHLEEAQKTLEQRKKFDELAEKITNNMLLRPRKDQEINLRKLEEECRNLEKESLTYSVTWKERREQFGRIVEEGMQLRRLIRDEKEEVERREGMDGAEEDGEVGEGENEGMQTPKGSSGGATPRQELGASPAPEKGLKPRPTQTNPLSRGGSKAPNSRASSPAASERRVQEERELYVKGLAEVPDTPMVDASNPKVTIDAPVAEGAAEEGEAVDVMDTT